MGNLSFRQKDVFHIIIVRCFGYSSKIMPKRFWLVRKTYHKRARLEPSSSKFSFKISSKLTNETTKTFGNYSSNYTNYFLQLSTKSFIHIKHLSMIRTEDIFARTNLARLTCFSQAEHDTRNMVILDK